MYAREDDGDDDDAPPESERRCGGNRGGRLCGKTCPPPLGSFAAGKFVHFVNCHKTKKRVNQVSRLD